MIKRCFIDLETTGLSPKRNGVLEIGGMIEYSKPRIVCEEFHFRCQPFKEDVIEQRALDINGITREEIATFASAQENYRRLIALLSKHVYRFNKKDKLFFIAYNANFDSQFLREFFKKAGDEYYGSYFWHPFVDVMTLAAYHLLKDRADMLDFHLSTVARHMDIKVNKAETHSAMYDVRLTRQLYYKLTKEMKGE